MKLKITKYIISFSIIVTFCIGIIFAATKQVKADGANIRYIITSAGADETSVGINYQVDITGSYVIYSKLRTFSDGTYETKYPTSEELFESGIINNDSRTGFAARYVCKVDLIDLDEDTTYYYKVVCGDSSSAIHSFKTYKKDGTFSNILFTTDLHSAASWNISGQGNSAISKILQRADINLIVQTGDQVDRGGYESDWIEFFSKYTLFNNKITATIPGNHEYYHSDNGSYVSPLFYNQFWNNPDNGPTERLNSTYYFHYGNAMFVMIDTINREYLKEQQAWFRQVMETNTSQWIIVCTHSGAISAGAYASDASWVKSNWAPLFEEYQVDLALSGHEHIYIRKDLFYKGATEPDLGVTYLVGCSGAAKAYSKNYTDGMVVYETNYSSNIITITQNNLTCTLYDQNGQETSYTFTLTPKRPATVSTATDKNLTNAIRFNYDKENSTMNVSWAKLFYGNVSSIDIEYTSNGHTTTTNVPIVATKIISKPIVPIYSDYNYTFKVTINKKDGTTLTKSYDLINRVEHNLNLELNGGTCNNLDNYKTYWSGGITKLPKPTKDGYRFMGWYQNQDFGGEAYQSISAEMDGDLTFYAKWEKEYTIKFETNDGSVIKDINYLEGDIVEIPIPDSTQTAVFKGWFTDSNFNGDKITEIDTSKPANLTLYAKWSHLCIITLDPNGGNIKESEILYYEGEEFDLEVPTKDGYTFSGWYLNDQIISKITADTKGSFTLVAKYEEVAKKKKCSKKALEFISILSSFSLLYFVFKKRH